MTRGENHIPLFVLACGSINQLTTGATVHGDGVEHRLVSAYRLISSLVGLLKRKEIRCARSVKVGGRTGTQHRVQTRVLCESLTRFQLNPMVKIVTSILLRIVPCIHIQTAIRHSEHSLTSDTKRTLRINALVTRTGGFLIRHRHLPIAICLRLCRGKSSNLGRQVKNLRLDLQCSQGQQSQQHRRKSNCSHNLFCFVNCLQSPNAPSISAHSHIKARKGRTLFRITQTNPKISRN